MTNKGDEESEGVSRLISDRVGTYDLKPICYHACFLELAINAHAPTVCGDGIQLLFYFFNNHDMFYFIPTKSVHL